jgi:CubicO group peptidase (beta-lactamase class C family)
MDLVSQLTTIAAETDFSGAAVAHGGSGRGGAERVVELVHGFADRANGRPNTLDTRFGTASATKGLTALAAASLIESGDLSFETTLRDLTSDDLPHVDPAVTVEDLLGHTSGVGDYLGEDAIGDIDDYLLSIPAQRLSDPDAYLPLVASPGQAEPPGDRFRYNNGGYVMLSVAIERATGLSFYDVVRRRVLQPAGMHDSGFFRSDRLPHRIAHGYTADGRTNVFHLPVRGAGDGGLYSTVDDIESLWSALFGGRIVSGEMAGRLTSPRSDAPSQGMRYGLGFWLRPDRPTVMLEGMDTGVSFRSAHDIESGAGYTVISNTSSGAWPLIRILDDRLHELA